eukprot:456920-Amphidinium_carterae.1
MVAAQRDVDLEMIQTMRVAFINDGNVLNAQQAFVPRHGVAVTFYNFVYTAHVEQVGKLGHHPTLGSGSSCGVQLLSSHVLCARRSLQWSAWSHWPNS